MRKIIKGILIALSLIFALSSVSCDSSSVDTEDISSSETAPETTAAIEYNTAQFYNPLSPFDAPDPFITYDPETEYYYALHTMGDRVEIFRHKHVADILVDGESKVVYRATGANAVWGDTGSVIVK